MTTRVIKQTDYSGPLTQVRKAARAFICRKKEVLMVRLEGDLLMFPGGGVEAGESLADCCRREVEEETGYRIEILEHQLHLVEYYGSECYENDYFTGRIVGQAAMHLTAEEQKAGLEVVWVGLDELPALLADFERWAEVDPEKYGVLYRETVALEEILRALSEMKKDPAGSFDGSLAPAVTHDNAQDEQGVESVLEGWIVEGLSEIEENQRQA